MTKGNALPFPVVFLRTMTIAACKTCTNCYQSVQLSPELTGKQCHRNFFLVGEGGRGHFFSGNYLKNKCILHSRYY